MFAKLSTLARSGLLALGIAGGLTVASSAAPIVPNPGLETSGNLIQVRDGRYSECDRGGDCWNGRQDRRWSRDRYWRGDRDRDWRGRHWRSDRDWSSNRYWRRDRDRRHHHRRHRDGPSFRIYLN